MSLQARKANRAVQSIEEKVAEAMQQCRQVQTWARIEDLTSIITSILYAGTFGDKEYVLNRKGEGDNAENQNRKPRGSFGEPASVSYTIAGRTIGERNHFRSTVIWEGGEKKSDEFNELSQLYKEIEEKWHLQNNLSS